MTEQTKPSGAYTILCDAASIVDGQRQETHGPRERSFALIAAFWSSYTGTLIEPWDVAVMMSLLKKARAKCGMPIRDHFLDAAGYDALAGELYEADDAR